MKKNGFTLIELITTFTLTAAIIVILTNVVLIIKDLYVKYNIKTELLIKQGDLNSYINDIITNGNLISYTANNNVYTFVMNDNTTYILTVSSDKIIFRNNSTNDTYTYKVMDGATINTSPTPSPTISNINPQSGDIIQIKIPITHSLFSSEDFGLNLIYIH